MNVAKSGIVFHMNPALIEYLRDLYGPRGIRNALRVFNAHNQKMGVNY